MQRVITTTTDEEPPHLPIKEPLIPLEHVFRSRFYQFFSHACWDRSCIYRNFGPFGEGMRDRVNPSPKRRTYEAEDETLRGPK
jgi:hypothetical protein